jgi:hypothetical protein
MLLATVITYTGFVCISVGACKNEECDVKWKLSLKLIFLGFLYLSICDICSDGCNVCCSVTIVTRAVVLAHE